MAIDAIVLSVNLPNRPQWIELSIKYPNGVVRPRRFHGSDPLFDANWWMEAKYKEGYILMDVVYGPERED